MIILIDIITSINVNKSVVATIIRSVMDKSVVSFFHKYIPIRHIITAPLQNMSISIFIIKRNTHIVNLGIPINTNDTSCKINDERFPSSGTKGFTPDFLSDHLEYL